MVFKIRHPRILPWYILGIVLGLWCIAWYSFLSRSTALSNAIFTYISVMPNGTPEENAVWSSAAFENRHLPAPHGVRFRLEFSLESGADLKNLTAEVDDAFKELSLNGTVILSGREIAQGAALDGELQQQFSRHAVTGKNTLEGWVVNYGGPLHFDLRIDPFRFWGDRDTARFVASALILPIAILVLIPFGLRRSTAMSAAVIAITALVFYRPWLTNLFGLGRDDWDQHIWFVEAGRRALFQFRDWPLWNPYSDGGIPLIGYPQNSTLNPLFFLHGLVGAVAGTKLVVIVNSILGMCGTFLLGRRTGLRWEGALLWAILFQFNGAIVHHLGEGHFGHQGFNFIPWAILFLLRSRFRLNGWVYLSGVAYALVPLNGSLYEVMYYAVPMILWCLLESARRRSLLPVVCFLCSGIIAAALAAPKVFMSYEYSSLCARLGNHLGGYNLKLFFESLLRPEPVVWYPGQQYFWHEYCAYLGAGALTLAGLGIWSAGRKAWPLLATLVFSIALTFGDYSPVDVMGALMKLPFLNSLLGPTRWNYIFIFILGWYAGRGLGTLRRQSTSFALAVAPLVFANQLYFLQPVYDATFNVPHPEVRREGPFRIVRSQPADHPDRYSALYEMILGNIGVIESYNPVIPERRARAEEDSDYRGLVYLEDTPGEAVIVVWKPSSVTVDIRTEREGTLVYNQNYFPGWVFELDGRRRTAIPQDGLVSAPVPAGSHRVELLYRPQSFFGGLAISAGALLFGALLFLRRRR